MLLGGDIKFFHHVDPDMMSYLELKIMVEELGYMNVANLFYKVPKISFETSLRFINDDNDIARMLDCAKSFVGIEVYVEHSSEGADGDTNVG